MFCSCPTLDIPWTLIASKSVGNGLGRRRRKKKLWTKFNQVGTPPGIAIRRPLLPYARPGRPLDSVWISTTVIPNIVSQEKNLQSAAEFLFAEPSSREFGEEDRVLGGSKDGVEAESGILEVVRGKIGVLEVGTSTPLDSKQNAEGSTLRELKCEAGMSIGFLNGRENDRVNDIEIRLEMQNPTQSRAIDRVWGGFKKDIKGEGWVLRGGTDSRTNVEVRFSGHKSSELQVKGTPCPELKSKSKVEIRVFKKEILECKTVGEVGFGQQCLELLEAEGMVLGESKNKTEAGSSSLQITEVKGRNLEPNILETRVNRGRQVVTALKSPMQQFEDKIEGEDGIMPRNRTTTGCFEKESKIDGKIMQADGFKHNHKKWKQGLMVNCNRDTSLEGKLITGKHSSRRRLVQSNLRSRKMCQKSGIETRSHKSYGGCIPSILQALESIEDIDKALQPWAANLGAKERSIILKEQCDWERALMIFKWFQSQQCYEMNAIHYNIMLRILGRAQKWDQLKKLWDEMARDNVLPTNTTYSTLIDVYGKAGLKDEALLWLSRMKMQGLQPDEVTMNTVVHIFKKAGEFEKAERFFRNWSSGKMCIDNSSIAHSPKAEFDHLVRNDSSFISSHAQGRIQFEDQMDKMDSLLNPFLGAPSTTWISDNKAVCPCSENVQAQRPHSSYTYNTLIDMYGKAGCLKEASNAFCEMLKEGIIPNTVTFNTMIHICGSHGYLEEADALMMKMEELRCLPDTRTYNILIALHARNDKIDIASSYFTKMKAAGLRPDNVSYRTLLYAFCIRHMVSEAESVVEEMGELGIHVDEFSQSAAIRMYIDLGLLQRAWAWFERFHIRGEMSSECYAANIDAYGERGYWLEAEKVFSCSRERRTKPSILEVNTMIKAYGIAKVHEKALKLFESMESQGMVPDQCTYKSLIQMLATAELLDEARCFLIRMQEAGFMPDCSPFSAVIAANGRLGQATVAEEIYKDMLRAGVEPDVVVYGALINAFAEAGRMEEAAHYFQVMQDAGFAGNSVVYNSLIKVYAKTGCLKQAEEIYKKMEKLSDVPDLFSANCMIELYTTAGMISEARAIFEDLKENGCANEFSFSMMLCLYKNNGRLNDAFEIAKEMQELGLLINALSFNIVIGLYATDGRLREATEIFQQMLKLGITPDDSTYKTLCTILMKGGIPKEVVHQFDIARQHGIRDSMEGLIVTLYSMVGMHDKALETCD